MKKYPKVKRLGQAELSLNQPVDVLEKVDGANFRFTHGSNVEGADDESLVFGSRNIIYKNEKDIDKNFEHAIEYVRDNCHPDHFAKNVQKDDELTIFAEAMHAHTLQYGAREGVESGAPTWEGVPNVLIFDAYSSNSGWLNWPSVKAVARRAGLPVVETYHENHTFDSPEQVQIDWSSHYRDGVAEGVVLRKARGGQVKRAKYRTEAFLDKHNSASRSTEEINDESVELAEQLLRQEPWTEKMIHKYENHGRDIEMSIMEDLWRDVFDDIVEEEYETIMMGNWDINTKRFRSHIAGRVAENLREYLNRPDGSVLNEVNDS